MFIDTHCHLHDAKFENVDEIVNNYTRDQIDVVIDMGCCASTSEIGKVLSEKYPSVYFASGCHPCDSNGFDEKEFERIRNLTNHPKCVAIGEIGLDYYWKPFDKAKQIDCFIKQIELANACNLPFSIHCRDATEDTLKVLKENKSKLKNGAVMHCYSGSKETAREILNLGVYISFAGPLTFKNGVKAREVADYVPCDFLLTETDSPYLSPEPFRGKRNEPKNVAFVTALLAKIKNIELSEFSNLIMNNAKRLFKKL